MVTSFPIILSVFQGVLTELTSVYILKAIRRTRVRDFIWVLGIFNVKVEILDYG